MRTHQVLIFSFILALAQLSSQAQFRIFAGPQMSSANFSIRNAKQSTEFKQGFMAGIGLTNAVEGPLYFSPSLYFSQKGYKVSFDRPVFPPDSAARNNNTTINALCFAPLLQLNFSKGKSHLFVRFGPAIDFALSGKEIFDTAAGKQVNRSMEFSSVGYSPATAYANVHLGFEHKSGFSIFANYEHGLSNLNNADLGPMILHRVVGLALGWKF